MLNMTFEMLICWAFSEFVEVPKVPLWLLFKVCGSVRPVAAVCSANDRTLTLLLYAKFDWPH